MIKQGNRKSWSNFRPRVHNIEIRTLGEADPANRKQGKEQKEIRIQVIKGTTLEVGVKGNRGKHLCSRSSV